MASSPTKTTPTRTARRTARRAEHAAGAGEPGRTRGRQHRPCLAGGTQRAGPPGPAHAAHRGQHPPHRPSWARSSCSSVREHGVLVPIVAIRTEQGVQVRYGQRRTLAAIEAGRPSVPVMVLSGEPGPELDRIIEQWHENEHRTRPVGRPTRQQPPSSWPRSA